MNMEENNTLNGFKENTSRVQSLMTSRLSIHIRFHLYNLTCTFQLHMVTMHLVLTLKYDFT